MVLFVLALAAPKPVWSAKESPGPAGEKVAAQAGSAVRRVSCNRRAAAKASNPQLRSQSKGEEIPATFGPIVTDTAIPVEKGKFAIQPTFGYSFVNSVFNDNWKRASAGGQFPILFHGLEIDLRPDRKHGGLCGHPLRPQLGQKGH